MRSDAQKHRKALVVSAARIFTRQGLDVPLQAILDDTGLGRGTLYRHFPDREALAAACIEYAFAELTALVEGLRNSPDLLRRYLEQAGRRRPVYMNMPESIDPVSLRRRLAETLDGFYALERSVIDLAKTAGVIPDDFSAADMALVIRMLSSAGDGVPESERTMEKALDIVMAGIRGG